MNPQATAGRIVHYYPLAGPGPIAAIVNQNTRADGHAELTVFHPSAPRVFKDVSYSEQPEPGSWSWMPYQKAKAEQAGGNQSESAEPRP